jgi:hypothetical protein
MFKPNILLRVLKSAIENIFFYWIKLPLAEALTEPRLHGNWGESGMLTVGA